MTGVFPFHLPPGPEFLGCFAIWTVGLTVLVRALGRRMLVSVTRAENEGRTRAGFPPGDVLEPGRFPRGSQLWTIAWLRGGIPRFAETLLATASAMRWLPPVPWGAFALALPARPSSDPWLEDLHRRLTNYGGNVVTAEALYKIAREVASIAHGALEQAAIAAGFQRSKTAARKVARLGIAAVLVLELPAVLRLLVRAQMYPDAPFPLYLLVAMPIAAVVLVLGARPPSLLPAGRAYLRWIDDATASLRAEVQEGRREAVFDVALAVGLAGLTSVAAVPLLAPFANAYLAHVQSLVDAATSSVSGDGSSSCSSGGYGSSCGSSGASCGGGGCGGGGCGGGGCS